MGKGQDDEAVRLSEQLAEAVAAGDRDDAVRLTELLQTRLSALAPANADSISAPDGPRLAFAAPPSVVPVRRKAQSTASARQSVVGALSEIGAPSRARLVADYIEARFGEHVEPRAFAGLRRDERRAWGKGSARPTYIVPALEGRFYQPIRGLLALSDWPLERRLIGPWSERADHLAATAQLARQLAWLNDRDPDGAKRLASVVAGMARSIPGAMDGTGVDTARVENAAEAERTALLTRDDPWRREAAARARDQLTDEQQLWGTTVGVVGEGPQEGRGRSASSS
ncbi:MAG TPA: hypothetical protein VFA11_05145 [Acidimicrobiales bacterium]|nr:hypothetical protein [Acidimicrobiales bacterium]